MNIIKSRVVITLSRIDGFYEWRKNAERLPKGAVIVSTITLVDKEAAAILYSDPERQGRVFCELDELMTKKVAERLEDGDPDLRGSQNAPSRRAEETPPLSEVHALTGEYTPKSFSDLLSNLDSTEKEMLEYKELSSRAEGRGVGADLHASVCLTLKTTDLAVLEENRASCIRLMVALTPHWRIVLLKTPPGPEWDFWSGALIEAYPNDK